MMKPYQFKFNLVGKDQETDGLINKVTETICYNHPGLDRKSTRNIILNLEKPYAEGYDVAQPYLPRSAANDKLLSTIQLMASEKLLVVNTSDDGVTIRDYNGGMGCSINYYCHNPTTQLNYDDIIEKEAGLKATVPTSTSTTVKHLKQCIESQSQVDGICIHTLSALAGGGKTELIVNLIQDAAPTGFNFIFSGKSIHLLEEVQERLTTGENPLQRSMIKIIHSDNILPGESCRKNAELYLNELSDESKVLLITDATLHNLLVEDRITHKERFILIEDELPSDFIRGSHVNTDTATEMQQLVQLLDFSDPLNIKPQPEHKEAIQLSASGKTQNSTHKSDEWQQLCFYVTHPHYTVSAKYVDEDLTRFNYIHQLMPDIYKGFKLTIMISALFKELLPYKVWSLQGVTFIPYTPIQDKAHDGSRLTIHYLMKHCEFRATRVKGPEKDLHRVEAALNAIGDTCTGPVLIHHNKGIGEIHNTEKLPWNPHGLNEYRHYNNIALLSMAMPEIHVEHFLVSLGLSREDVRVGFHIHDTYQCMMRCSLRDKSSTATINAWVGDKATAMYLANLFPGCTIKHFPVPEIEEIAREKEEALSQADRRWLARMYHQYSVTAQEHRHELFKKLSRDRERYLLALKNLDYCVTRQCHFSS